MESQAVHKHPRIQGGVPVFTGTRAPVKNLFDYLEAAEALGSDEKTLRQDASPEKAPGP